jgi:hypothetical protein
MERDREQELGEEEARGQNLFKVIMIWKELKFDDYQSLLVLFPVI